MRRTLPFLVACVLAGCGGDAPDGPTLDGTAPPVDGTLAPEADLQPGGDLVPEATLEPDDTLQPDSASLADTEAPQ